MKLSSPFLLFTTLHTLFSIYSLPSVHARLRHLHTIPNNTNHTLTNITHITHIHTQRQLDHDDQQPHTPSIAKALQADYFQLKLYWQQGYYWQEERRERRWCVECKDSCKSGNAVAIKTCDDDDKKQRWVLKDDKLSPYMAQSLCMYHKNKKEFKLRSCKSSRDKYQKFDLIKQFEGKKEDSYEFHARGRCMTQRHHPKSGEVLRLEPCDKVRKSDTSIWQFGGPWDGHGKA